MKKTLKKGVSLVLVACMVLLTMVACSAENVANTSSAPQASSSATSGEPSPAEAKKELACLITEVPKGAPFTDLTWKGFEKLEAELGTEIKLVEAMDKAEYPEQIRAMAQLGASPIYSMFDTVNEVVLQLASEFPDTKFYLIDCEMENEQPNVVNLIVDPYEASYLAGFVAAKTTKTNKIGWIGHTDHPTIVRFLDGYTAGAKYANPNIVIESAFTGDPNDPVKGQETAKIIIDKGVDVIFQSANQSGMGVIKACAESGIKCIGVDDWQGSIDPCVFWSALKDIDGAIYETGKACIEGNFSAGRMEFGLKTNSKVYDQRDFDKLPKELQDEVSKLTEDIRSGKVDVFAK